jgi:hypothetical protein
LIERQGLINAHRALLFIPLPAPHTRIMAVVNRDPLLQIPPKFTIFELIPGIKTLPQKITQNYFIPRFFGRFTAFL